jgi:hypothetical protein
MREQSAKPDAGTLLTMSVNKADPTGIVSFDTSGHGRDRQTGRLPRQGGRVRTAGVEPAIPKSKLSFSYSPANGESWPIRPNGWRGKGAEGCPLGLWMDLRPRGLGEQF